MAEKKIDVCSICLQPLELSKNPEYLIIADPCNHLFHQNCIERWVKTYDHATCPNCRGVFNSGIRIGTALTTNNTARILRLVNAGANINALYEFDRWKSPPLYQAAAKGDLEVVKILLENGADLNKECALYWAVSGGNSDVVKIFLAAGANINAEYRWGEWDGPPLYQAAAKGDLEVVKILLEAGANVEKQKALYWAVSGGNSDIVKIFLAAGANINSEAPEEQYLRFAAYRGFPEVVQILLDAGANIGISGRWTALHSAVYGGRTNIARLLLDRGADIEARDKVGETALHKAAKCGNLEIVKLLLDRNADIEARDTIDEEFRFHRGGETALHKAAANCHIDVVNLLLDRGAKINVENDGYCDTPLDLTMLKWDDEENALRRYSREELKKIAPKRIAMADLLIARGGKNGSFCTIQ